MAFFSLYSAKNPVYTGEDSGSTVGFEHIVTLHGASIVRAVFDAHGDRPGVLGGVERGETLVVQAGDDGRNQTGDDEQGDDAGEEHDVVLS